MATEILGTNRDDDIRGTVSDDMISALTGNDSVFASSGNDLLFGGNGNDILQGGRGNDTISAGNGSDILFGQGGNDLLFGGNGNDVLNGGAGNDTLSGGNGVDTFQYRQIISDNSNYFGNDVITDFHNDQIDLSFYANTYAVNFEDLSIYDDGQGNAIISVTDGNFVYGTITLEGVAAGTLSASDFLL